MPSRSQFALAVLLFVSSCRPNSPDVPCTPSLETCGVGACAVTVDRCSQSCVPATPRVEQCDGVDDDCDGLVDEDCECAAGEAQPCYSGSNATRGVGACHDGTQSCDGGFWASCVGDVLPTSETCNGLDDDCNAVVDDQVADAGVSCATNLPGQCAIGQTTCSSAAFSCQPVTPSSDEACDGVDNDCDGVIDDGNPDGGDLCNTGLQGACARGTTTCAGGAISCANTTMPTNEVCDSIDNDCDGTIDDVSAVPVDNIPNTCATAHTRNLEVGDSITGYIELGGVDWFYVEYPSTPSIKVRITQNANHYRLETFINCGNTALCPPATSFESTCVNSINCSATCGASFSKWSHLGVKVVRISGTRCTPYTIAVTL